MATFGSKKGIDDARKSILQKIKDEYEVYSSLNEGRNPLAGIEMYIIPLTIAFISFILGAIFDGTCSSYSQSCRNTSELLSHVFAVVAFFMIIVACPKAQQIKEFFDRVAHLIGLDNGEGKKQKSD